MLRNRSVLAESLLSQWAVRPMKIRANPGSNQQSGAHPAEIVAAVEKLRPTCCLIRRVHLNK